VRGDVRWTVGGSTARYGGVERGGFAREQKLQN
jgi:hypothetical protein